VVEPDTVADDLRWEAKPLVGRRTAGHQTSSSQKQAIDHPATQIAKLTVPSEQHVYSAALTLSPVNATDASQVPSRSSQSQPAPPS
jgi:hypothetical protein